MRTAITWANVLVEKKARARIMDVDCIFASVMIKRRGCWVALSLQRKKLCNKIQESKLYSKLSRSLGELRKSW